MAMMDSRIPFMGVVPDYVNALATGTNAAMLRNEGTRQNALAGVYQAQGPGILAGDPQALNALAGLGEVGQAMGVMDTRQGMEARDLQMDATRQNMDLQMREWAASMDARERQARLAEGQEVMGRLLRTNGNPEAFDALMIELGKPEMVGRIDMLPQMVDNMREPMDLLARFDAQNTPQEFRADRYRNVEGVGLVDLQAEGGPSPVQFNGVEQPAQPAISPDQLSNANTLRDDLRSELGEFSTVQSSWQNIETFFTNPGGVSDYALAVAFAKILDPGSVAREGEVAAVANSGSLTDALRRQVINAIEGTGSLPEAVRLDIARLAAQIYNTRADRAQSVIKTYGNIARDAGLPVQTVYTGQMPRQAEVPTAPQPVVAPPPDTPVGAPPPQATLPPPGPQPAVPATMPVGQTPAPTVNELSMMGAVPTSQFMPPPAQASAPASVQSIMSATRDELVRMDVTKMTPEELRAWNAAVDALEAGNGGN